MLDVRLIYQAPLVKNPEPDWLATAIGDHYGALRLFHEACWAWEAFVAQRAQPYASVRWGMTITSKADLYEYALECRRQALLTGFFLLSTEQLDALAALSDLTANQIAIRDCFLALCDRHEETNDLYGQELPLSLFEVLRRIEKAPPYRQQGECALTKRIRLGNQAYFAKLTDETMSGQPPSGMDELQEVTTSHALCALHAGIGPAEAYHIIAADGQQCALIAEVPGKAYRESSVSKAAALVDVASLQWVVLAEWLLGVADRHFRNLLIDKATRRAGMIDMAFAWRFHWYFLGWNEDDPPLRFCESYARALLEQLDPQVTLARAILQAACDQEAAVLATLAPFPLPTGILDQLRRQFAIVRDVLSQHSGDLTVAHIEHVAQIWYNERDDQERGDD